MGKKRNNTVNKNFSYTSLIKLLANNYKFKSKENHLHLLKKQPINLLGYMLLLLFPVLLFSHPSEAFSTLGGANVLGQDQSGPETSNGNDNDGTSSGNDNDGTSSGNDNDVSAWTLTVNLVDKPLGDDEAGVEVRGSDGYRDSAWYDWSSIQTGPSTGTVVMNMPESAFPSDEPYEVCASSGDLRPYVMPNCSSEFHSSGNEAITKSLR